MNKIEGFQYITIESGLRFFLKTGMKVNTAYTLKNMLAFVSSKTGKKYTAKTKLQALLDLQGLIREFMPDFQYEGLNKKEGQ